jgi:hypothetical protein
MPLSTNLINEVRQAYNNGANQSNTTGLSPSTSMPSQISFMQSTPSFAVGNYGSNLSPQSAASNPAPPPKALKSLEQKPTNSGPLKITPAVITELASMAELPAVVDTVRTLFNKQVRGWIVMVNRVWKLSGRIGLQRAKERLLLEQRRTLQERHESRRKQLDAEYAM